MTLTQNDFDQIEKVVNKSVEEKTKHLPTKDEFYSKMDDIMGELKTIREEQIAVTGRFTDHEDRLEKLEEIHPSYQHSPI